MPATMPGSAPLAIRAPTDATTDSREYDRRRSLLESQVQIHVMEVSGARPLSTTFVGRRDELARLRSLLANNRLLTITGPGGSGKTRLAEELVAHLSRSFDAGIAVAYLAGVGEPAQVGEVVMAAVGLRGGGEPRAALVDYLGSRRFLLVLDNCEHVRDSAAELVTALQRACEGVIVLATSRRPLMVPGEQLFPIEGLPDDAAVTLFTDRVRLAAPSFVLDDAQRSLAVRLCSRLDGMPLAIELAAARLRHLGLTELDERLPGRIADLGSLDLVAPARQRTLRGAIDWSHDLLDEPQRILWRRLSIFAGGFTVAAAEHVAAFPPIEPGDVERVLGELVDRSLVAFDLPRDRYRLIEALREYGLERLRAAAEEPAAARRHRAWMLERAIDLDRRWWGPDQARMLDEMAAEAANLRAALESSRGAGAGEDGLRIAAASLWYWLTRASHAEAARWFVPFLEHASDPALGARAHVAAAWIAVLSARIDNANAFLAGANRLAAAAADPGIDAYIRLVTGLVAISEGRLDAALEPAQAALTDPAADAMCRSWALVQVGIVAFLRGDLEACARTAQEGIDRCRADGESWTQVIHLHLLAAATWRAGDARLAASVLLDALRIDQRLDDIWHRSWTIEASAWVTVDLGRPERAARLLGIAAASWDFAGTSLTTPWRRLHETAETELRRQLGAVRFAREFEAGRRLDQARALSFVLDDVRVREAPKTAAPRITPREFEVAALVAEGLGNRDIGERLFLSPRTVESHVQHLMDKLGVGSRAEIAAWHTREVIAPPVSK